MSTRIAVAALALLVGVLFVLEYRRDSAADRCALELVQAAGSRDQAALERMVRAPALRERLAAARQVELGFVRGVAPEWSRVGLVVRTATAAVMLNLMLDERSAEGCTFVADYEGGAFGR